MALHFPYSEMRPYINSLGVNPKGSGLLILVKVEQGILTGH